MSRTTPSEELDLIESIVAVHPRGIGISDIEAEMARRQNAKVNRRTLQRRLQKLTATKRVSAEGQSIALVYKPSSDKVVELTGVTASATLGMAEAELYVSLSRGRAHS